ncbi:hypothetical protein PG995_003083 [Apiospora arundinis]
MPRKVRVPADREANRQSQQQVRQRQREYLASLEKRVAEYERQGVHATIEVQQAARAVAATNQKLLALLKIHGVQDAEIDAFLLEPELKPEPERKHNAKIPPIRSSGGDISAQKSSLSQPASQRPLEALPLPSLQSTGLLPRAGTQKTVSQNSHGTPSCNPPAAKHEGPEQTNPCQKDAPVTSCSPNACTQPVTNNAQELPGQETSCDTAARIISELHGLDDLSRARAVLGCTTRGPCSVRNMRLFELMDRTE